MISIKVQNLKPDGPRQLWFACSPEDPNAEMITFDKIESDKLYIPPVTMVSNYESLFSK